MKIWKSDSDYDNVFIRGPERGVVSVLGRTCLYRYRDGKLQYFDHDEDADEEDQAWSKIDHFDRHNICRAISKLWPAPTKKQLWRRVLKIAGELVIGNGLQSQYLMPGADWCGSDDSVENIRSLIALAKHIGDCAQLVDKLESALAEWEAAK